MSRNSQMIKKPLKNRRAQVVVESVLLLTLIVILGITVFRVGRSGIYSIWSGMRNQIDGPCAKCSE